MIYEFGIKYKQLLNNYIMNDNYDNYIEKFPNGNIKLEIENGKGKKYYPSGKLEYEGEFSIQDFLAKEENIMKMEI